MLLICSNGSRSGGDDKAPSPEEPQEARGMNMNEHIQYLADHAAFLCSLSRLSNQTDEMKKLMKSSAEAALKAAGTILSMMEDEERKSSNPEPKKPTA